MPKILKNKKVKRFISKKKLKSKNKRKLNIRSKKLKSKKYQGVIQRKSKKAKCGGKGMKKSRRVMRGGSHKAKRARSGEDTGPNPNSAITGENVFMGKPFGGPVNMNPFNIERRKNNNPREDITFADIFYDEDDEDYISDDEIYFNVEDNKVINDLNSEESKYEFIPRPIPIPKLNDGSMNQEKDLYQFNTSSMEGIDKSGPEYAPVNQEIVDIFTRINEKIEKGDPLFVGEDALLISPENQILSEGDDIFRVGVIDIPPTYNQTEKGEIQVEHERIKNQNTIDLICEYYDIHNKYYSSILFDRETINKGLIDKIREEIKINNDIELQDSDILDILQSRMSMVGGKSSSKNKKKYRNKFSKKIKSNKINNKKKSKQNILNYQEGKLNKKKKGGNPKRDNDLFYYIEQMKIPVPLTPNPRKNLKLLSPERLDKIILVLESLFENLGKAINENDVLEDFEHDFTGKSQEDKSLKENFEGGGYGVEDSSKIMNIIDYNSRINFIPLDLEDKKKRNFWKDGNNTMCDELVSIIRKSISLVDAGKFVIGGFSVDGECSKHLSNIVDPATTGRNTEGEPYLLHGLLKKIIPPNYDNFESYFINLLLTFIQNICTDINCYFDITHILKVKYGFQQNKLYFLDSNPLVEWNGSQAPLANMLIYQDPSIVPRSKRSDLNLNNFLIYLVTKGRTLGNNPTDLNNFNKLCKLMKYMGDKSHIVQAILYILLLEDEKQQKPKVIIKTLDRLLFKCVCQVIHRATYLKDKEDTDDSLKEYFKDISENLGVMYGCNFTVANVFKNGIDNGKMYTSYYSKMSQEWCGANRDIDKLGEHALYSNFKDKWKSIGEFMISIYEKFQQKIIDPIHLIIFRSVTGLDDVSPIDSFMTLYNNGNDAQNMKHYILGVVPFPFLDEGNGTIVYVNLFPQFPKELSKFFEVFNKSIEQHTIGMYSILEEVTSAEEPDMMAQENEMVGTQNEMAGKAQNKMGAPAKKKIVRSIPYYDTSKYSILTKDLLQDDPAKDKIYQYMLSCRKFLESYTIFRQYINYNLYLTFYQKAKFIVKKYIKDDTFINIASSSFLPGYGSKINRALRIELKTGIRGMYTERQIPSFRPIISNSKKKKIKITYTELNKIFGDRLQIRSKLKVQRKFFPYFKISMKKKLYTTKEDPYKSRHYLSKTSPPTPWPCEGGFGVNLGDSKSFKKLTDIRYSIDPSNFFSKLTFINTLFSDKRFIFFLNKQNNIFEDTLDGFKKFKKLYIQRIGRFVKYYEKVQKRLTLDVDITAFQDNIRIADIDSSVTEKTIVDKIFFHNYGELAELFKEYYVEAYILGVPLIYFMEFEKKGGDGDKVFKCNYDFSQTYIPLKILKYDDKFSEKIRENDYNPLFYNTTDQCQELYLSVEDYDRYLKSILESIRNLYYESKELLIMRQT